MRERFAKTSRFPLAPLRGRVAAIVPIATSKMAVGTTAATLAVVAASVSEPNCDNTARPIDSLTLAATKAGSHFTTRQSTTLYARAPAGADRTVAPLPDEASHESRTSGSVGS